MSTRCVERDEVEWKQTGSSARGAREESRKQGLKTKVRGEMRNWGLRGEMNRGGHVSAASKSMCVCVCV